MPIYDYRCLKCDNRFEQLVRSTDTVSCPSCTGSEIERLMSLPARHTPGGSHPDYSRLGPPPSGGCCGGGCQSHQH